jgi:hypothetical protein
MNKQLAFLFLFCSTIAAAKSPMTLTEIVKHIQHHPATIEKEKALNDFKKAGMAAAGAIVGGWLLVVVKNWYEAPHVVTTHLGGPKYLKQSVSESLPVWVTIPWVMVEVAALCYAGIKGRQGAEHLIRPDHKLDMPETHVRVKRAQ